MISVHSPNVFHCSCWKHVELETRQKLIGKWRTFKVFLPPSHLPRLVNKWFRYIFLMYFTVLDERTLNLKLDKSWWVNGEFLKYFNSRSSLLDRLTNDFGTFFYIIVVVNEEIDLLVLAIKSSHLQWFFMKPEKWKFKTIP